MMTETKNILIEKMVHYFESIEIPKWMMDEFEAKIERHYLFTKKNVGTCPVCGHEHHFMHNMHHEKITCTCGKELEVRTYRSNTNFGMYSEYGCVQFYLRDGDTFIRKSFAFSHKFYIDRSDIEMKSIEYQSLEGKKLFTLSRLHYYWRDEPDTWQVRRYNFVEYTTSNVNWMIQIMPTMKEYIQGTDLQYSQIDAFMMSDSDQTLSFDNFIILRKYPVLELFWKAGLHELYSQFINNDSGKREVIKFSKAHRKDMIRFNLDMKFIRWYYEDIIQKKLMCHGLRMEEIMQVYKMTGGSRYSFESLIEVVEILKGVATFQRALRYEHIGDVEYRDYLRMMEKLGTPVKNIMQAFPSNLDKAHDEATRRYNLLKQKLEDDTYEKIKQSLKKYKYESSGLCIVLPEKATSINEEGRALAHCVGSYVDRVLKKETVILFVRRLDDITKPYFTLEYQRGKVQQCRGYKNQKMTDDVKAFVEEWERWLDKQSKKHKNNQQASGLVMQGAI